LASVDLSNGVFVLQSFNKFFKLKSPIKSLTSLKLLAIFTISLSSNCIIGLQANIFEIIPAEKTHNVINIKRNERIKNIPTPLLKKKRVKKLYDNREKNNFTTLAGN
jgi:hypothetical protein